MKRRNCREINTINSNVYKYTNMVQNTNYPLARSCLKITIKKIRALSKQTSSKEIYKANKGICFTCSFHMKKILLFNGSTYHLANIHNKKEYYFFERSSSKAENFQSVHLATAELECLLTIIFRFVTFIFSCKNP